MMVPLFERANTSFFGVLIDVAQAVEVARLEGEAAERRGQLAGKPGRDAIFEAVVGRHGVLRKHAVGTVGIAVLVGGPSGALLRTFAEQIGKLGAGAKSHHETIFLAPRQARQNGQLHVVHLVAVGVGQFVSVVVEDVLAPTDLGEIEFHLQRAECFEIEFAGEARRDARRGSEVPKLLNRGVEADAVHGQAGAAANGKAAANFAQLSVGLRGGEENGRAGEGGQVFTNAFHLRLGAILSMLRSVR